ncbi:MAG: class I SAM-dependent methyltransferase [Acidobacteria bacterium]|nr:class I SAM-dependent methyltransferase [Acidobacteriota bacterium]
MATHIPFRKIEQGIDNHRERSAQVSLAKWLMKLLPGRPNPDDNSLNEVFRHGRFINATDEERKSIMLASAQCRYDDEIKKPLFELYFAGYDYKLHLTGKRVLDFGCFTGGRGVRWAEQYGINKLYGTDINSIYIEAAVSFAARRGIPSEYRVLDLDTGAHIPFADGSMDAVVSFDVFEHVDDLHRTLEECARVLAPGGVVFAVFPSFYNPLESHLGLATRMPGLQWLFSPRALTRAYLEVIVERGEEAYWYQRSGDAAWEKLPTLNGTTPPGFRRLLVDLPFECVHETRRPILITGSRFATLRRYVVKPILNLALTGRFLDSFLLDRIALVLRRI